MLFKFFLLALPILIQCAPQDNMAKAVAAAVTAAKDHNGGGDHNENFDCVCHPIHGKTNNTYSCKCHSSDAGEGDHPAPAGDHPAPAGGDHPAPAGGDHPAPAPAAPAGDPLDEPFGDTYTYVMCLKRDAGAGINTKPTWDWLQRDSGNVQIKGKWMPYMTCSYGTTTPYQVLPAAYQKVLDLCKGLGYEDAQPADSIASNWYPFQIDQQVTEFFHETSYLLGVTYDRIPQKTVDKC